EIDSGAAVDRARVLQQLADALVALDEPFRTTVIRRYLDGETAAQIAREQGVPAGTVRWRLHTGLARLRAALDAARPRSRWPRAIVEHVETAGGELSGRVINWSTGDGVAGAELTFAGDAGAITLRTEPTGDFELVAPHPASYTLVTITSPGFLPYAPEYLHSP